MATDGQERSGLKLGSCSTGINRFNRKRFRLTQLTFSNGTLSQPYSVEKRSLLGRVITRLPRNLPVVDPQGKHDGCSPCSCSLFFFLGRFRRRCGKKWIKGWTTQMPSFLCTRRVKQAVQIAQLITHIRARKNNSGRYQCFFNRFNPVWCELKKLSNQTNQKRFFANRTRSNSTNPTNLKRLIPIEHDLGNVEQTFSSWQRYLEKSH